MAGFKEYQMMFQLNASMGGSFQSAFSAGSSSVSQLQEKINALNKTQSDISSYQKQQTAIDRTKAKIELYSTQLANLQNATASTSKEEAELANAIAAKQKQLDDSTAKLDQQNAALSETGAALRAAGVDTNNLATESERLKAEAQEVATAQKAEAQAAEEAGNKLKEAMSGAAAAIEAVGLISALKSVYGALSDCSTAAAEFETSMAGVKRTVGGSDAFISDLGNSFKELSTTMPITATELAGIATTAGQLGIHQDKVESFTTVMAQLATTTDLTADNAATMLAQFTNITGITDYERLGSTVAALGDSTATTASKVVEMSQGMAAAANIAGMSGTDVLAISAAVGSLGIEAAAGSTSMSQLITKLYKATETGDQLEQIAAVAGMTGAEFKQAWGTDAVGALDSFIQGLNNVERNGKSAVVVLDELGINNVRQTKAILGLASAGGLLSNTINVANSAWNENTALAQKAGIMYNTTEAKLTMMGNAANNVKIAIGDALNPAVGAASDALSGLLQPIAEWIQANPAVVQGIVTAATAFGVATTAIVGFTAAVKLAHAASLLFASIPGLGAILALSAGLGILVAGISAACTEAKTTAEAFNELNSEYDDMVDQFAEQAEIKKLVNEYKDLGEQADNIQTLMKKGFKTTVSVDKSEGKLTADDFIDSTTVKLTPAVAKELVSTDFLKDSKIKLTPEQASYLASKDFIEGNLTVELTPEQAKTLTSYSFLSSTKVQLTPEQKAYLKSDDFIDGKKVVDLTPEQAAKLQAAGFLDGTTVKLTAAQANELAASGFLDGQEVQLTAIAAKRLQASSFMAGQTVTITGEAGNTLTAADFGISEQTLTYIATMDETSYADVQEKAAALRSEMAEVSSQLTTAQSSLAQSEQLASALTEKISGEKNRKKKTALQEQLEQVNESITQQRNNVDELQLKYDVLSGEYSTVSTAADELKGKEAELLSIKQQLSGVIPDVTTASEEQAAAYNAEAEAAAKAAEARQDELRIALFKNITQQSAKYVQSIKDEEAATEGAAKAADRKQGAYDMLYGESRKSVSSMINEVKSLETEILLAQEYDPELAKKFSDAQKELFDTLEIITGIRFSMSELGDAEYSQYFEDLSDSERALMDAYNSASGAVDRYDAKVAESDKIQQDYIDNLVNAVQNGIVDTDQLRKHLNEAFADAENGGEIVDDIMEQVQAQLDAAAAAAENFAEGEEEISEMSDGASRSVEEIVSDLKDLQKEYDEAYKSAYSSMSGQFKLFEDASAKIKEMQKGYKGGTKGMTSGLESQKDYVEKYTANFTLAQQKLAEAGVSAETANTILASLSDGSAESGAALESIASGSTDDAKKLAETYKSLQEAKDKYAQIVADTTTNFSEEMAKLAAELETTIAGMDKSSEAATNAKATLSAYVNAADGYVGLAAAKYGAVAAAAVAALKRTFGALGIPGFAKGTTNAPKGMAIVGEEGPELVYFNGGETVVPADQTERIAENNAVEAEGVTPGNSNVSNNGSTYTVTFSPQFNVESGANADQIRSVLEEQSGNMREQLEELLADIAEDENRRNLR